MAFLQEYQDQPSKISYRKGNKAGDPFKYSQP